MSTVIIAGGGSARAAIIAMENQSITWTEAQRMQADKLLAHITQQITEFTAHPQPPA